MVVEDDLTDSVSNDDNAISCLLSSCVCKSLRDNGVAASVSTDALIDEVTVLSENCVSRPVSSSVRGVSLNSDNLSRSVLGVSAARRELTAWEMVVALVVVRVLESRSCRRRSPEITP